jgi:(p)ppGpp synthase/HD superfamily hydrolase
MASGRKNEEAGSFHYFLAIKIAADHAARAHKRQLAKDRKTPFITHPAKVAGLVGTYGGTHVGVISAWLHDIIEDCDDYWISQTYNLINELPLVQKDRKEIRIIVDALTKKKAMKTKSDRLSDSLDRILLAPPEATLVKICDRIDNLLDLANRNGQFRKRYLASTDDIITRLSTRAEKFGYDDALSGLKLIRKIPKKKE